MAIHTNGQVLGQIGGRRSRKKIQLLNLFDIVRNPVLNSTYTMEKPGYFYVTIQNSGRSFAFVKSG